MLSGVRSTMAGEPPKVIILLPPIGSSARGISTGLVSSTPDIAGKSATEPGYQPRLPQQPQSLAG